MLNIFRLFIWLLVSLLTGCQSIVAEAKTNQAFMLTNINVVDVKAGRIIRKQNVCVAEGVIKQVSSTSCLTSDMQIIDGRNGYLTPGLIDMHVHMFEKQGLTFALSHGVTHVRLMNGVSAQLTWRDEVTDGTLIGSSATVSSPIISGYTEAISHHGLKSSTEARKAVRYYHEQGYDLIKAYTNLDASTFVALIEESRKLGIPVAKHGPQVPEPLDILDFHDLQSYEHVEDIFYNALDRQLSLGELAPFILNAQQLNVPVTPTLNVFDQLTQLSLEKDQFLAQLPQHYISTIVKLEDKNNQIKRWLSASEQQAEYNKTVLSFLLKITKALHDANVPLLIGSDSGNLMSPHGLATHNEMRLFSQAGIDTFSILKYATVNAANALGLNDQLGQIKPGFAADFIYSLSNPVSDLTLLSNPKAVVKAGKWFSDKELKKIREQAVASKNLWSELKVYSEMITR